MKRSIFTVFFILMTAMLCIAQSFIPIASNFNSPLGVEVDHTGMIWVIESGSGAEDGQVTRMTAHGSTEVIVTDLPSFFNPELQEINGPLNIVLNPDGQFYLIQGGGPSELSGTIMKFHLDDYYSKGASLTSEDARSITYVSNWVYANGFLDSNPYSMVINEDGSWIISDAGANALLKFDPTSEEFSTFATFPPAPNPLPFGPPFIDAVPTKVMSDPGGGYLVSQLTGFPFVGGAAKIFHVADDGTVSDYVTGLTLVTDMAIDNEDGRLVALQFAQFGAMGFEFGSAQLIKIKDDKSLEVMATGFGPSPGMGIAQNGNIYVSNIFTGQILALERCAARGGSISASAGWTKESICVNDGLGDPFDIIISSSSVHNLRVITDESGNILKVENGTRIDLEGSGVGTCKIWNVAYDGTLPSFVIGSSLFELLGCVSISNAITIDRLDCQGCHTPLNLRARHRPQGGYDVTWDQVKSAVRYSIKVGYKGQPNSFVTLKSRKNRTVLHASSDQTIELSVAAICGFTSSEYSEGIEITPPKGYSSKKSFGLGDQFANFALETLEISVNPNPASDFINISSISSIDNGRLEIFDLAGRRHVTSTFNNVGRTYSQEIKSLNAGVYIVAISNGDEILIRQKLVITR